MRNFAIILFCCGMCLPEGLIGQSAMPERNSIQQQFSAGEINAYQQSSGKKTVDFYEYLTLYSQGTDPDLKKQLRQNIQNLFGSLSVNVVDMTSSEAALISLDELLKKIENKNYSFQLSRQYSSQVSEPDHWVNSYRVSVKIQGNENVAELSQKVYFTPVSKEFGETSKIVWELRLGEIFLSE